MERPEKRHAKGEIRGPGTEPLLQAWQLERAPHHPEDEQGAQEMTSNVDSVIAFSAAVDVPGHLRGVREILVTPEPRGGSVRPTHAPVIIARLA